MHLKELILDRVFLIQVAKMEVCSSNTHFVLEEAQIGPFGHLGVDI
jgi:hypothetical protein